ncbi:glycosyltransferase family 2 protein [Thermaurantiacus sp.]
MVADRCASPGGPLVSIITPAWKAARFLPDTFASVAAQTFEDWEHLVADDCSPDETRSVVAAAARRDPRVRLVQLERNGGPAAARNAAIGAARGRYLAFLDADDLWLPEKLERQLALMEATGAALSYTGFRRVDADGRNPGHHIRVPARLDYRGLLRNTAIATSTVMIDTWQTGPIVMQPVYYDDLVCWLGILRAGKVAIGLDEDLMRYRVVNGSISRNKLRSAYEVWKIYRHVEQLPLHQSLWSFLGYASHAVVKYSRF